MTQPLEKVAPVPQRSTSNVLQEQDLPIHDWYRFVLSYPPHLVRRYSEFFGLTRRSVLFDPFCGTGTTLVEGKKNRITTAGCDAHPFATLASRVKTNWHLPIPILSQLRREIIERIEDDFDAHGLERLCLNGLLIHEHSVRKDVRLTESEEKLLPTGFLSIRPLRRLLLARNAITDTLREHGPEREFFLLALAHVIANGAGNFAFGPEIYRTKPKPDYDVLKHFACQTDLMLTQLVNVQREGLDRVPSTVTQADARNLEGVSAEITAVITSPPYPNEKDYTRTTRVESLILGLLSDRESLRRMKESLLRSNTRNIFVDDKDGEEVREIKSIQRVCAEIEGRRIALNKTSGFERLYHRVVAHYFGGMRRHFRALRNHLRKRAQLAYVVGDQMSFLMVPVPTATLLGEIAEREGYQIVGCDLWRERVGTKVRNDMNGRKTVRVREEVLLLKKR